MPRIKKILRYSTGIVEYEVTDETHWAQMVGTNLVRCDHIAKEGGPGLVTQFNSANGQKAGWQGRMPDNISVDLWVKSHHLEVYLSFNEVYAMERDIS